MSFLGRVSELASGEKIFSPNRYGRQLLWLSLQPTVRSPITPFSAYIRRHPRVSSQKCFVRTRSEKTVVQPEVSHLSYLSWQLSALLLSQALYSRHLQQGDSSAGNLMCSHRRGASGNTIFLQGSMKNHIIDLRVYLSCISLPLLSVLFSDYTSCKCFGALKKWINSGSCSIAPPGDTVRGDGVCGVFLHL